MKVLITGGAGFIGSNLARALVNEDYDVTVVDDLSMGVLKNIQDLPGIHFYKKSVCDYQFMHTLLKKEEFDYIYFLAAVASVADSIARPLETHQVNSESIINALDYIRQENISVKRILFSSSAAVYGDGKESPKKESSSIQPLSPYAIDKFSSERYMIDYGKLYGLPTVCVRFFNVYGPHQNPESPYSGVLSILTKCLRQGKEFTLYGDGSQVRDFIFVTDVVNALLTITKKSKTSEVFNIANGHGVSLKEIIGTYQDIANTDLQVKKDDFRKGDISQSVADITKLEKLGFRPEWSLNEGLEKYWEATRKEGIA